jgi:hypothetical protein
MADKKTYKIGRQIIHEDDLKIPIDYKGDVFTLKYPTPIERAMIESEIARRLGGMPREAFTLELLSLTTAATYVDNLIIKEESPSWFTSAWQCLDEEVTGTLYTGYLQFREKLQQRIRDEGFARDSEGAST